MKASNHYFMLSHDNLFIGWDNLTLLLICAGYYTYSTFSLTSLKTKHNLHVDCRMLKVACIYRSFTGVLEQS